MSNAKNQPSSPTHTAAFLRTSETHQEAKDLGDELKKRGPHRPRKPPDQYLAIERLGGDNELLQGYARTHGGALQ
jgi:hypothetical protein